MDSEKLNQVSVDLLMWYNAQPTEWPYASIYQGLMSRWLEQGILEDIPELDRTTRLGRKGRLWAAAILATPMPEDDRKFPESGNYAVG